MKDDFKIGLKHWAGTALVAVVAGFVIFGLLRGQEALKNFLKSGSPAANLGKGEIFQYQLSRNQGFLDNSSEKSPNPISTLTPSPSKIPTPIPSLTPAPTLSKTPFPSPSPSPTLASTPTPLTPTPIPSLTQTPTPTPTLTPTLSPIPTPSPTPTPTPVPTPTPTPTPPPPPSPSNINHILISEIQLTGGPGKTANDFIELYNPTDSPVDITGWKLRKRTQTGTESSIRVFSSGKVIPARGFFLWANSGDSFAQSLAADESSTITIAANNSIAFLNSEGEIIDAVAWGENLQSPFMEGNSITAVLESGQSYERKVWQDVCISSQGAGEVLGNGCDTNNNMVDFEIRPISNPQNSQNQPEP